MKKTIIFLSLLSLTFLLGCQESYKKKNDFMNSVSGEAVVQRDNAKQPHIKTDYSKIKDRKIKMSDVQGITEKMVYRERERRQGEQCYYDKETQNEFYLYEEEGDGARFVTYRGGCQLFGNAKKTAEKISSHRPWEVLSPSRGATPTVKEVVAQRGMAKKGPMVRYSRQVKP